MSKHLASGFVLALIFMGAFMSYVLAHEVTHLAIAEEAHGICLGRCSYSSDAVKPSSGIAFATASGAFKAGSVGEFWPRAVGLFVGGLVAFVGVFCFFKTRRKE